MTIASFDRKAETNDAATDAVEKYTQRKAKYKYDVHFVLHL